MGRWRHDRKPPTLVPLVVNLNAAELGGLLWLLDLGRMRPGGRPPGHLRLGGGKPLGFGSVRVWVTSLDLFDGEARRQGYRSFFGTSGPRLLGDSDAVDQKLTAQDRLVTTFKKAIENAYGSGQPDCFETVALIGAFLAAARGFSDLPVHYPRLSKQPDPAGENYKWFVENAEVNGCLCQTSQLARDCPLIQRNRQGPSPRNRSR